MNYLSHYAYNHAIRGLAPAPYFVMGVALPDLWSRYTRARRIRWKSVVEAETADPIDSALRGGLLNHIEADRRFHCLPAFLAMQRSLKSRYADAGLHGGLLEFLSHVGVELALDHALLRHNAQLADEFYDRLARCNTAVVEERIARLGSVDTQRLGECIEGFVARRFLRWYRELDGLVEAMCLILERISIQRLPPRPLLRDMLRDAIDIADPDHIWRELASRRAT